MTRLVTIVAVLAAALATGVALASGGGDSVVGYRAGGQTFYGVRPTAVGLPDVGERGTIGANALADSLKAYHDSGTYARDLAAVDRAAQAYIVQRLAAARSRGRTCVPAYEPVRHGSTLYRRVRHCHARRRPLRGKPALVLDIDETSLSNYADMAARDFDVSGEVLSAATGHGTAIEPTLVLYRAARARGVAVFFVTGRPAGLESVTVSNLHRVGYGGWAGLYEKPAGAGTEQFKSSTRAAIQRRGYDILANVGDQQSDLDGDHADRDFKLPDPFYFISD